MIQIFKFTFCKFESLLEGSIGAAHFFQIKVIQTFKSFTIIVVMLTLIDPNTVTARLIF